ncbi:MAG: cob(I)yrinic acid a,c-diamide adenosyltransferase [Endomicrobia bacterium]|nr:cob(I)yrinic acid a,c-diamide adenosyltransferase [Endomicrobiia bacterium]
MKGLVHIYTGNGKGKTTSAVGLITRAIGQNMKCCFITFHKDPKKYGYGEVKTLRKLGVKTYSFVKKCPFFDKIVDLNSLRRDINHAFNIIKNNIFKQDYNLIVIDELLVCIREDLISIEKVIELIKSKRKNTELILTGQANISIISKIKKYVDYISYVKNLKHPFDIGVKRRKGIEY